MTKIKFAVLFLAMFMMFPAFGKAEETAVMEVNSSESQAERVERAKTAFPVRLNELEKNNISKRCTKAQEKLSKISTRLSVRGPAIAAKYSRIELHLSAIQKRLAAQQIDTSIIDLLITNFQQLSSDYNTSLNSFQASLSDAVSFDCASEPVTFKALLEDVRAKRKIFVNSIEAIKNFTKEDLKTSFDDLRTRLNNEGQN